jgi:hypothetical protein
MSHLVWCSLARGIMPLRRVRFGDAVEAFTVLNEYQHPENTGQQCGRDTCFKRQVSIAKLKATEEELRQIECD